MKTNLYDKSIRDLRRMLDTLEPLKRELRGIDEISRYDRLIQPAIKAIELQNQLEVIRSLSAHFSWFHSLEQRLVAATKALPDLHYLSAATGFSKALFDYEQVSNAIREARLIGALELGDDDDDTLAFDRMLLVEQRLVEVVSPEEFEALRHVEFAPFRLLDNVLQDPEAMRALGSREFEEFVAALVDRLGFKDVILTPKSGDHGRDVIATAYAQDIPIVCAFECKRYAPDKPVGPDMARALLGVISHGATRASKGILVTTSYLTPAAWNFILTEPNLEGRDFNGIVKWIKEARGNAG